ncbi:MAG: hypothetical protein H6888_10770 [Nitratireductor sp.]|nr:hypothetical protein [Nitratireductor sp.]
MEAASFRLPLTIVPLLHFAKGGCAESRFAGQIVYPLVRMAVLSDPSRFPEPRAERKPNVRQRKGRFRFAARAISFLTGSASLKCANEFGFCRKLSFHLQVKRSSNCIFDGS